MHECCNGGGVPATLFGDRRKQLQNWNEILISTARLQN